MSDKMKSTDSLNVDMAIRFFDDLVVLLKELKARREKADGDNKEGAAKPIKI